MDTTSVKGVELRTDGDVVVLSHNRNGDFEKETFDSFDAMIIFVSRYKQPVFIDVGAYTGIYSIYAAMMGCRVESFEPNPKVHERFEENAGINFDKMRGWNGAISHNRCALSDKAEGYNYFNVNPAVELTSGGSLEGGIAPNTKRYPVQVNTYDGNYDPKPDIIKIDVEGHEMSVLRGMKKTLISTNAFVIIEANTEKAKTEILEFFSDIQYLYQGVFDERNLIFSPILKK